MKFLTDTFRQLGTGTGMASLMTAVLIGVEVVRGMDEATVEALQTGDYAFALGAVVTGLVAVLRQRHAMEKAGA